MLATQFSIAEKPGAEKSKLRQFRYDVNSDSRYCLKKNLTHLQEKEGDDISRQNPDALLQFDMLRSEVNRKAFEPQKTGQKTLSVLIRKLKEAGRFLISRARCSPLGGVGPDAGNHLPSGGKEPFSFGKVTMDGGVKTPGATRGASAVIPLLRAIRLVRRMKEAERRVTPPDGLSVVIQLLFNRTITKI
jgi:hypothetical protein